MADDTVRSVTRALMVMQSLQKLGAASLAALQADCPLPKPTLLRLLHTLESERVVWRAAGDGLWRPAFELRPTQILKPAHQRLIDVAMPVLEDLRERVVWPSDLAVPDGPSMLLLETTRRASGLAVNRDRIGHRIDPMRSAVGRAWLSALAPADAERVAASLARRYRQPALEIGARIAEIARLVQSQGYAEREAGFGGRDEPIDRFDDQLSAIAVPIRLGQRVLGAINVVWLRRFDAKSALVGRHLRDMQASAHRIAKQYALRGTAGRGANAPRAVP